MIKYWSWLPLAIMAALPPAALPAFSICGFRFLTGLLCPLCGMTHGLIFWMHGEWKAALHWHLLTPIPFAILLLLPFGAKIPVRPEALSPSIAAVFLIYGALRWCAIV